MTRAEWIARGLCPDCGGKEPLLPGLVLGAACQARRRAYRQGAAAQRLKARNRALMKATREEYLRLGLCPYCYGRQKVAVGRGGCRECLDERNARYNARRERRKTVGLCSVCGGLLDREGSMCVRCRDRHAIVQARAYRREVAAGRCVICGQPAQRGKTRCAKCARDEHARLRALYQEKVVRRPTCDHTAWRVRLVVDGEGRAVWLQWCRACRKTERHTISVDPARYAEVFGCR